MSFELNKTLAAKRPPLTTSTKIDPVTAGIIRGAFETVCFEAATHLGRAAGDNVAPGLPQEEGVAAGLITQHGRVLACPAHRKTALGH